jgi:hypothetical protein
LPEELNFSPSSKAFFGNCLFLWSQFFSEKIVGESLIIVSSIFLAKIAWAKGGRSHLGNAPLLLLCLRSF